MLDEVRDGCRRVSELSRSVTINYDRLDSYAASLPLESLGAPTPDERDNFVGSDEAVAAFVLTLDSINFGSGYFPHLLKPENLSGYFTIASALKKHFETQGMLTVETLCNLRREDCAGLFGQDLEDAARCELMTLFAQALNDLGEFVGARFDGVFLSVVEAANGSVESLAQLLVEMPFFQDVATYRGLRVSFYKRAQITAADFAIRGGFSGLWEFHDVRRLTIFADNVIPNVLRVDGLLTYESGLAQRIAAGELLASGSEEEIEIRASALHTVELLVEALRREKRPTSAMTLDSLLWNRGRGQQYKASPRHRSRSVFY